jgi:flagellar biosynthesis regulator FlaF
VEIYDRLGKSVVFEVYIVWTVEGARSPQNQSQRQLRSNIIFLASLIVHKIDIGKLVVLI